MWEDILLFMILISGNVFVAHRSDLWKEKKTNKSFYISHMETNRKHKKCRLEPVDTKCKWLLMLLNPYAIKNDGKTITLWKLRHYVRAVQYGQRTIMHHKAVRNCNHDGR